MKNIKDKYMFYCQILSFLIKKYKKEIFDFKKGRDCVMKK